MDQNDEDRPFPWKPIAEAPVGVEIEAFENWPGSGLGRFAIARGTQDDGPVVWRTREGRAFNPTQWMHVGDKERVSGTRDRSVIAWHEELER